MLTIALDTAAGIVGTPAPADREAEPFARQCNRAISTMLVPEPRDLAMKRIDISEGDVRHLHTLAEMRQHVLRKHSLVVGGTRRAQTRVVLLAEACDQSSHVGCFALGLDGGERIAALVDLGFQLLGPAASIACGPTISAANRVAPLPTGAGDVTENESFVAGGGYADAEARHGVVVDDAIAACGGWQTPDHGVGQMRGAHSLVSPCVKSCFSPCP